MKCPICNGKGTQFIADYDGMYDIVCDKCKGKGELDENGKPILTNEEYLKSCTTEQLAEWIAHQSLIALLENQNNHSLRMTYPAYWVEWLKQPHTTIKE